MRSGNKKIGCTIRLLGHWKAVVLSIIVLLCVYFIIDGVEKYREDKIRKENFVKYEAEIFRNMLNYKIYGISGISFMFLPSQGSIFTNNSMVFTELVSKINTVEYLRIGENLQGKALFKQKNLFSLDYSRVIILFGSLFSLFLGFKTFRDSEYKKMRVSIDSVFRVFFKTNLKNILFLSGMLLLFYSIAILTMIFFGIQFAKLELINLLGHLFSSSISALFCYTAGLFIGIFVNNKLIGTILCFIIIGIFILFIPALIENDVVKSANKIDSFKIDLDKIRIQRNFENEARRIIEKNKDRDLLFMKRKLAEGYLKKEYLEIESLDIHLRNKLNNIINNYNNYSILSPISFQILTANEVGSQGYSSFIDYYDYLIEMKHKYTRFWYDQVYYNDPKVMVSFIKGDENVFRGKSKLPPNYWKGVAINSMYIVILLGLSYIAFLRLLFNIKKEDVKSLEGLFLEMEEGKNYVWSYPNNRLHRFLYILGCGKNKQIKKLGYKTPVTVCDFNIVEQKFEDNFVYICRPSEIPGEVKVKDLIRSFAKNINQNPQKIREILNSPEIINIKNNRFDQLSPVERFDAVLSLLKFDYEALYVLDDLASGLMIDDVRRLSESIDRLVNNKSIVVLFVSHIIITSIKAGKEEFDNLSRKWKTLIDIHSYNRTDFSEFSTHSQGEKN